MKRLEVSGEVRHIYGSLGVKRLIPPPINLYTQRGWHISEFLPIVLWFQNNFFFNSK